jgi:galactokinase
MLTRLPELLAHRARHVLSENERVLAAVDALSRHDFDAIGALLNASHASLRDDYGVSTAAVEATVASLRKAGASGARIMGGGFGGHVLGLLAADLPVPPGACVVTPAGPGAALRS